MFDAMPKYGEAEFFVGMKVPNIDAMKADFHRLSSPQSEDYGNYHSLYSLHEKYAPPKAQVETVSNFFKLMNGAKVEISKSGDMLKVTGPVASMEQLMDTELVWHTHAHKLTSKRALRAVKSLVIPDTVSEAISFISLNSPVNHAYPRGTKALSQVEEFKLEKSRQGPKADDDDKGSSESAEEIANDYTVSMYVSII